MKKKCCFIFAFYLLFFSSCQEKKQANINDFIKSEIEKFQMNSLSGDTLIITKNENIVYVNTENSSYKGLINIEIIEGYENFSIIANGLSTMSNEGILESNGMIKVITKDSIGNLLNLDVLCGLNSISSLNNNFQLYQLNEENNLWELENDLCKDIDLEAFYALRSEDDYFYNYVMHNDRKFRLDSFMMNFDECELESICDLVGKEYQISFKELEGEYFYDYAFEEFPEKKRVKIEAIEELFDGTVILPYKIKQENGDFIVRQDFRIDYSKELMNDIEGMVKLLERKGVTNKSYLVNKLLFKLGNNLWYNADRLLYPKDECIVDLNFSGCEKGDHVYAIFDDIKANISLGEVLDYGSINPKLPKNEKVNILVVGVRDDSLVYFLQNFDSFSAVEVNIPVNFKEVSAEELKKIVNNLG
jgi:hypothetical protein